MAVIQPEGRIYPGNGDTTALQEEYKFLVLITNVADSFGAELPPCGGTILGKNLKS